MTISTRPFRHAPPETPEAPEPVAIGRLGLFLPFLLVLAVLMATGRSTAPAIALAALFFAIPVAILVVRWRAHPERAVAKS